MPYSKEDCAAYSKLRSLGYNDIEIKGRLGWNQKGNKATDVRKQAELTGILTLPQFHAEKCGLSESEIDSILLGCDLRKHFVTQSEKHGRKNALSTIRIYYPNDTQPPYSKLTPDQQLEQFGQFSARCIRDIICNTHCKTIGVSWGKTPRISIDVIRDTSQPSQKQREVFPLCGFPLSNPMGICTAAENAKRLHDALNGPMVPFKYPMPFVPALMPANTHAGTNSRKVLEDLINLFPLGYNELFGPIGKEKAGTVANADMILTSLSLGNALGSILADEIEQWAHINIQTLRDSIKGDIAGVVLPREPERKASEVVMYEKLWTGITRNHLEHCARRAMVDGDSKKRSPGVIVVAIGEKKAATCLECILAIHDDSRTQGLISHLICDEPLARKLKELSL